MAKPYNDKKLGLGPPVADILKDFCAANYNVSAIEVIREAVLDHIKQRLKEPAMEERYERARTKRLNLPNKVVRLVDKKD